MKTKLNTIFFLCNDPHKEPASLTGSLPADNPYHGKNTLISRQLIYKSTADDVFWVLHSKLQPERQLECLR